MKTEMVDFDFCASDERLNELSILDFKQIMVEVDQKCKKFSTQSVGNYSLIKMDGRISADVEDLYETFAEEFTGVEDFYRRWTGESPSQELNVRRLTSEDLDLLGFITGETLIPENLPAYRGCLPRILDLLARDQSDWDDETTLTTLGRTGWWKWKGDFRNAIGSFLISFWIQTFLQYPWFAEARYVGLTLARVDPTKLLAIWQRFLLDRQMSLESIALFVQQIRESYNEKRGFTTPFYEKSVFEELDTSVIGAAASKVVVAWLSSDIILEALQKQAVISSTQTDDTETQEEIQLNLDFVNSLRNR